MSSDIFVTLHDCLGTSVWSSGLESGVTEQEALSARPWHHAVDDDREKVRGAYALCLLERTPIAFTASWKFGGRVLRYRSQLFPANMGQVTMVGMHRRIPNELSKLSDREREIMVAHGTGRNAQQIAAKLKISLSTLNSHRGNIRRKLGLQTHEQVLAYAVAYFRD